MGKGRAIFSGQKIHVTVAFKAETYRPKAKFVNKSSPDWPMLVGKGDFLDALEPVPDDWKQHIEMDLFDNTARSVVMQKLDVAAHRKAARDSPDRTGGGASDVDNRPDPKEMQNNINRLTFMALSGKH